MEFRPPYKGFEDLGLGMNLDPYSFFISHSILSLFLLVACLLHFSDWLHTNYIGNAKDSILSSRSFEIHPELASKMVYIWVCKDKNSYVYSMLLGTFYLLMLNTYKNFVSLSSYSNFVSLGIYTLLRTYSDSASLITWHLNLARHLKFT